MGGECSGDFLQDHHSETPKIVAKGALFLSNFKKSLQDPKLLQVQSFISR
jgi:hypothetical protein